MTAPCLIDVFGANDDAFVRAGRPLRAVRRISANDAYRKSFCDVLRDRKKLRHRFEWLAPIVLIQSGNDYAFSRVRKLFANIHNVRSEELSFIDTDDLCFGRLR